MGRHLRIAMVTETYPPEVNGVARTVGLMAEGLKKRGHAIQLDRVAALLQPLGHQAHGARHPVDLRRVGLGDHRDAKMAAHGARSVRAPYDEITTGKLRLSYQRTRISSQIT